MELAVPPRTDEVQGSTCLRTTMDIQKLLRGLNRLDVVAAAGSVGYGVYASDWLWVGGGLVSAAVAWWSPAQRVQTLVQRYLTKKRQKLDDSSVLATKEALYADVPVQGTPAVAHGTPTWSGANWTYGAYRLNASRHNVLHKPGALVQELSSVSQWS